MSVQQIGSVSGAVIDAFFGGAKAEYGFMGSPVIGGSVDPSKIIGPSLLKPQVDDEDSP